MWVTAIFRFCLLPCLLSAPLSLAALPPDAQALLNSLPGKQLSLEVVIRRAVTASDSFRALNAQLSAIDTPWQQALAMTDPRLVAKANWMDDRREPLSPFSPTRVKSSGYSLGLSTLFTTGTSLNAEVSHGLSELGFSQFPGFNTAETKGMLTVSQNLWQDAFGYGTRASMEGARLSSEAGRAAVQESKEDWFFQLADLYYAAWLAQAQQAGALASLKRRERLLQTVGIKVRRGTSERPDLLQVQSAIANAEAALALARQSLADKWRTLVISLKLPVAWLTLDPIDIPMALDDSPERALDACGDESALKPAPTTTPAVQRQRLQRDAAKLAVEKAESDLKPDLELGVGLGANGVDTGSGTSLQEIARWEHPVWMASLSFSMPLGFRAEKARLQAAVADEMRADATTNAMQDTLKVQWLNGCLELHRLARQRALYERAAKLQLEREKLEEERFQIGRSGTLQVIQAGDDATQSQVLFDATESQLRISAWRVERMQGKIEKFLSEIEGDPKPSP